MGNNNIMRNYEEAIREIKQAYMYDKKKNYPYFLL